MSFDEATKNLVPDAWEDLFKVEQHKMWNLYNYNVLYKILLRDLPFGA